MSVLDKNISLNSPDEEEKLYDQKNYMTILVKKILKKCLKFLLKLQSKEMNL